MRFVIRKGSLCKNLFLTRSHRWGHLDKAQTFTIGKAGDVGDALGTRNFGIFSLGHARSMVRNGLFSKVGTGGK